ncbi:hypothetical protein RG620_001971 [Acinetobacter baumannii]|nr:hypothetical protein [Acinetobacter baumannii]
MTNYIIYCYIKTNKQAFDLNQVEAIEVFDTDFCGGMITSRGQYNEMNIFFKSGNQLNITTSKQYCDQILNDFEKLKVIVIGENN